MGLTAPARISSVGSWIRNPGGALGGTMDAGAFLQSEYYQSVLGALALIVVLSMVLERALSVPFEWSLWSKWLEEKMLRAPISFAVAWVICFQMHFDLLPILTNAREAWVGTFSIGTFLTAGVIAGGSKGAILLFQGILGFSKQAVDARVEQSKLTAARPPAAAPPPGVTAVQWWQRRK